MSIELISSRVWLQATLLSLCFSFSVKAQNNLFAELQIAPSGLEKIFANVPDYSSLSLQLSVTDLINQRIKFGGDNRAHLLLILNEPLTPMLREELKKQSLEVIDRFDENIWIARVSQNATHDLDKNPVIESVAIIPPQAKLSHLISLTAPFEWQKREDADALGYEVMFHKGVSAGEAMKSLSSIVSSRFKNLSNEAFPYVRSVTVALTPGQLSAVTTLDAVQFIEPQSPPNQNQNLLNTQPLSNVNDVQGAPYNLTGAGVTVGVWEYESIVRPTHQDMTPRVVVEPEQTSRQHRHALHVAGTIGASGVNAPNAEGMAPEVNIRSWDAEDDTAEMAVAAQRSAVNRPVASNHSYGRTIGWYRGRFIDNQALFGSYTTESVAYDTVIAGDGVSVTGTELVVLQAAGNDRTDAPGDIHNPDDCNQASATIDADCVGPVASAKNVITVGAMNGEAGIADFSGFGPTNDGRIKPDIMANGTRVLSLGTRANPQTDTGTFVNLGTSMSTPAVTGIVALMAEQLSELGIAFPSASAIKAILIQTANDVAGTGQATVGPDYATGWGIADAQAAMDLLRRPGGPGFAEGVLSAAGASGAWEFPFVVPEGQPELHITLAWSDLPGTPTGAGPELVNDLDLRLIPPGGGTAQQPWRLNPANPTAAAIRNGGDDNINNVEQVSVLSPAGGTWIARVTAKPGSLALGPQRFAIAGPITPDTGPIAGPKANIMMVLDKSGSMILPAATPGLTKMQALQKGARAFVDYIELIGGHNLGVTAFEANVVSTNPPVGLQALEASAAASAHTAIGNLTPGGSTGIIDGMTNAVGQLSGINASNPDDVIVLFSDGKHNSPSGSDVAVIDGIMADDTRFFSIGYGTDVDSTIMPGVAANHDGVHLEEQSLQAGQLAKLFMVVGGLAVDEAIIVDPDYTLEPNEQANQTIFASKADHSLTFAIFWNEPNSEKLSLRLSSPNKMCRIPMEPHQGFNMRRGAGYWLIRVDLPYTCMEGDQGAQPHSGKWHLNMRNVGGSTDTAKVVVLSNSGIKLHPKAKAAGGQALLTASLIEGGKLLRKGIRVIAQVQPNRPSSGDSEKQDAVTQDHVILGHDNPFRRGSAGAAITIASTTPSDSNITRDKSEMLLINPDQIGSARIKSLLVERAQVLQIGPETLAQLQGRFRRPTISTGVELLDDGTGGDAIAGDGIYSVLISIPKKGLYQARIIASQARTEGKITREGLVSFLSD